MRLPNLLLFLGAVIALSHDLTAHADDSLQQCLQIGQEVTRRGAKLTSPVPQAWSQTQFSDPRHHDPNHFVYIVHGVGSDLYDLQTLELGSIVDYTWVSIISNDAPFTYAEDSGLIMAIEPDNVVSDSCYDTMFTFAHPSGGGFPGPKELKDGYDRYTGLHTLLTPEQMLLGTLWPRWMSEDSVRKIVPSLAGPQYRNNELLLRGRSESGHVVKTIGVFINHEDKYLPTIEALKEFAKKYALPILEFSP